jgi:hypothetical protein
MTKVLPSDFSPELVTTMKSALDQAVHRIAKSHRTPATTAKMAERIVRTASEGVTDKHTLMCAAVDEGRVGISASAESSALREIVQGFDCLGAALAW